MTDSIAAHPRIRRRVPNVIHQLEPEMKLNPISNLQSREEMERNTLRLLCSVLVKPGTRLEICRLLHPDDFLDPVRKVVFEEVEAAGVISSKQLRTYLPARMCGRGFPGFDLDKLLAPKQASEAEIERLFESTIRLLKLDGASRPALFASEADVQD
jgi:hypothetical protein